MASFSRHSFISKLKNDTGKSFIASNKISPRIRQAVSNGEIQLTTHVLEEGERLDSISMLYYKSSEYWWIIAAASGIGWSLQVPPGTLLQIPKSIDSLVGYLR
tara:strand:- start:717 stop:1025 length:309 start_codon:yes stop_codon:yes gene_type:complete